MSNHDTIPDRISAIQSQLVVDENGCHVWTGYRDQRGYGRVSCHHHCRSGNPQLVHRILYEHLVAPVSAGIHLHHQCRNPACANPDHLTPLTAAEHRRLHADAQTHCKRGHEWTAENTYTRPNGSRLCNQCRRDRMGQSAFQAKTHCVHGHEFTPENTYLKGSARCCRQCNRERMRTHRGGRRDERNARLRRLRAENPEKFREATRRWRAANPEKVRELDREYKRRAAALKQRQADAPVTPGQQTLDL